MLLLMALTSCRNPGSPAAKVSTDSKADFKDYNLVLVTIDTLRADRLHCYGNKSTKTPTLDGIADRGARFVNAVAQAPLTPPSHASIFTGTNPNVHQVRNTGGFKLKPSSMTLARILKAHGRDTAAFVGASVLKSSFGFNLGFDTYDDQMPKATDSRDERESPERRAEVVVDHAVKWLSSQSGRPYFLWVHLYDPHEPYNPPEPFRQQYRDNLYDGEIAYTDEQLGRLLNAVAEKSPPAKTIVVVVADHGESLGDHGEFNHGVFLYDSTLRIPLLMAGPGIPQSTITQQVRSIDILPTILDLLGGQSPEQCQGTTLTPSFHGKSVDTNVSYEETLYPKMNMGWAELRGIRTDHWKYVRAPQPELYDLETDSAEKSNVIATHQDEAQELDSRLEKLSRIRATSDAEPVAATRMDSETRNQLKSLGYLSGAVSGEVHLDGKGDDPKTRTATLLAFQRALGPDSHKLSAAKRIDLLRRALSEDSKNPSLYFYLAAEYEQAGQYDEAISTCESAAKHGVMNGRLLARLGDLYLRSGRKEQAIAAYEKAEQYDPSDIESQTNLGTAYLETGKPSDAERCFRRVLMTEDYAPAHNGLGLLAIQRRDGDTARAQFEKAVAMDPSLVEAQLNLGLLYKMAGDIPRAKECFEAFLQKAPGDKYGRIIPQVKEELAAMR